MYIYLDDTTRVREPLKNYKELHESKAVQHDYYRQSWGPFLGALTQSPVAVHTGRARDPLLEASLYPHHNYFLIARLRKPMANRLTEKVCTVYSNWMRKKLLTEYLRLHFKMVTGYIRVRWLRA